MSYTLQEIESQPEVWQTVIGNFFGEKDALAETLGRTLFSRIVVIGCGSTYYLAKSAAYFLELYTGYTVQTLPASEAWLNPALFPVEDTLLLAISRSGTTTETLRAVERFRAESGAVVAVVTCYPESPLAEMADVVLSAASAQERSVVQTRSFTSMYLLSAGLSYLIGNRPEFYAEMEKLPRALETLVTEYGDWPQTWADLNRFQKIFFLGNGPNYGLACEAMLKVKEMSLTWVEAFHTLEFRHGPMSLVDEKTLVVGYLSETMGQQEMAVLRDLQNLGGSIVVCGDDQNSDSAWCPDFHIQTKGAINEWLRGLLYLPLMQRMGYQRALANHQNPDQPRNLKQVIEL
jgi:glucosamine--fructose-6-phosphate aminotransferase (isomerizing)